MVHVIITITVSYDETSVDPKTLSDNLKTSIGSAIGQGMLSPTGREIVDEHEVQVSNYRDLSHRQF
jgi:hypothetical protein